MRVDLNSSRLTWVTHFVPLFVWIAVILFLSSPQGSMAETSRFIRPLIEFLFPTASAEQVLTIHGIVRKCAHFTEYGILALLSFRALTAVGSRPFQRFLVSIALVALVAVIDEVNQSLEPTRTGSPWDVSLDLVGGVFVALLCYVWSRKRANGR